MIEQGLEVLELIVLIDLIVIIGGIVILGVRREKSSYKLKSIYKIVIVLCVVVSPILWHFCFEEPKSTQIVNMNPLESLSTDNKMFGSIETLKNLLTNTQFERFSDPEKIFGLSEELVGGYDEFMYIQIRMYSTDKEAESIYTSDRDFIGKKSYGILKESNSNNKKYYITYKKRERSRIGEGAELLGYNSEVTFQFKNVVVSINDGSGKTVNSQKDKLIKLIVDTLISNNN